MALSTNWRFTADKYASNRDGNDANAGTQAAPYKTLSKIMLETTFKKGLRAGFYNDGQITNTGFNRTDLTAILIKGDGLVIIDGSAFSELFTDIKDTGNRSAHVVFDNILLQNINSIGNWTGTGSDDGTIYNNCIVKNSIIDNITAITGGKTNAPFAGSARNSIFIDSTFSDVNNLIIRDYDFFRNTYINTPITLNKRAGSKRNCVFDNNSNITIGNNLNFNFINCAFEGNPTINGVAIQTTLGTGDGVFGSTTQSNGTGTITYTNCVWSADVGFNNTANDDYTLKQSPQSILFNNNNIIGKHGVYLNFSASHSAFDPINSGVSYNNIDRNLSPDSWTITGANTQGDFTSTDDPTVCLTLPFETTINEAIKFFGDFNFFNGEWVDKENYNNPANLEVRQTFEISGYDESEPNGLNNPLNFSPFYENETETPFELDGSNLGNGNISADLTNLGAQTFKRFRVRVRLRNDGV